MLNKLCFLKTELFNNGNIEITNECDYVYLFNMKCEIGVYKNILYKSFLSKFT